MYSHELYNNLPSLREARSRLLSLEGGASTLLGSLVPIFKNYPQFGVCLVHAHCELEKGEKMISSETGRVSEPIFIVDGDVDDTCYPERWLANGDPYEFSRIPKSKDGVPKELAEGFHGHLKSYGGQDLSDLLGLFCINTPDSDLDEDVVWLERTEGRKNIVEPVLREGAFKDSSHIPASWHMTPQWNGSGEFPVYGECVGVCVAGPDGKHEDKHTK